MILIKLPTKALKQDTQKERDNIEDKVYAISDRWRADNPSFKDKSIDILWGTYFDIQGKGLPDASPERMWLYKAIKAIL